jgi:hypothetical protein
MGLDRDAKGSVFGWCEAEDASAKSVPRCGFSQPQASEWRRAGLGFFFMSCCFPSIRDVVCLFLLIKLRYCFYLAVISLFQDCTVGQPSQTNRALNGAG